MPKIDLAHVPLKSGSIYPAPYDAEMAGRRSLRVGDAGGLSQFGANIVILAPGAKSSLRHYHMHEDEFVMVIAGTLTLIEDDGPVEMGPGTCAAFPAGKANGHHLINATDTEARFLVIGTRSAHEVAHYSDVDMKVTVDDGNFAFTRRDGSPLDPQ